MRKSGSCEEFDVPAFARMALKYPFFPIRARIRPHSSQVTLANTGDRGKLETLNRFGIKSGERRQN